MKEETKNKLKKASKLALGAALLAGSAYAGKKAYDKYNSPEQRVKRFFSNKKEEYIDKPLKQIKDNFYRDMDNEIKKEEQNKNNQQRENAE